MPALDSLARGIMPVLPVQKTRREILHFVQNDNGEVQNGQRGGSEWATGRLRMGNGAAQNDNGAARNDNGAARNDNGAARNDNGAARNGNGAARNDNGRGG